MPKWRRFAESATRWRRPGARPCRRVLPDGLRQRHHTAPELVLSSHVHIVLAHEVKLATGADSVNRKARGKHLDGGALAYRRLGVGERLLDEDGLTGEAGRGIAPIDVKLVLALDRHVDPGLCGVEVEMPRTEMHAIARLDRGKLRQDAILEGKCLERT